jgi:hypothetical protein
VTHTSRPRDFATLSGLGDAFLVYPVIVYFSALGRVRVSTKYPEVFEGLHNVTATTEKIEGAPVLRYSRAPGTNYYLDICKSAGVHPLRFVGPAGFKKAIPYELRAEGDTRPVCLIKEPSTAHMDRKKRDFRLAANYATAQNFIISNRKRFIFITAETDGEVFSDRLVGVDLRLSKLSVREYLELCASVDAIASQIGHLLPIAQAFRKPLTVFRPRGPLLGFVKNISAMQTLVPVPLAEPNYEVIG